MRKAEEYINSEHWCDKWYWTIEEEAIKAIKQAQMDAIEETVKLCAKNVKLIAYTDNWGDPDKYLDKQSLLDCAEILKKEIE